MWEMVDEKDPDFFARLDEGFLMREDKTIQSKSILFNDKNYTDKDYYKEYATIYHLRKELFEKYPPKYIYVFRNRMATWNSGLEKDPKTGKKWATTMCHAWFVWEKGSTSEPIVRWLEIDNM